MQDELAGDAPQPTTSVDKRLVRRRRFLVAAGGLATAGLAGRLYRQFDENAERSNVFIAKAGSYADDLERKVREGLTELGIGRSFAAGKSVLLKPNLVEPSRDAPHINTHPALVRATAEVFRALGAREVFVAEGQGHCRDSDWVLDESGLAEVLSEARLPFVDLNHDDVFLKPNLMRFTKLEELGLPSALKRADIVVSMPKLKTHHWAGVTLSMKNLFGVMPGVFYGWPKNVLHHAGIPESILDITATVRPHLAIVDGIVGMEGDGPIMGTAKPVGAIVMGTNLPAVDATAARLMTIDPWRVAYLRSASGRLGPVSERHITQRGETIRSMSQRFALIEDLEHTLRPQSARAS
jgi:uncharacterized protein (DUF362 family)